MEISHSTAKAIVQTTTVDIFNERDQSKRRQLMEKYWSPNLICYQPAGAGTGYENIDRTFEALHSEGRDNYDFSIAGQIWANHNLIYVAWEFGPGGVAGEEGMRGSDIILVGKDSKVEVLYAMIEGASTIE